MPKKVTGSQAMIDLAKRKHVVPTSTAKAMIKKFKAFRKELAYVKENDGGMLENIPDLPIALSFNKKTIAGLIKPTGCVGIRISFGINAEDVLSLILEGLDAEGNIITTASNSAKPGSGTVDEGQQSPPYP